MKASRLKTSDVARRAGKTARRRLPALGNGVSFRPASPFGPGFFQSRLGILARERCPESTGAFPLVTIHLSSGESIEVCYVLMIAEDWVALGVPEEDSAHVRTELVPYETILRVTIRPSGPGDRHIGFEERLTTLLGRNGDVSRSAQAEAP